MNHAKTGQGRMKSRGFSQIELIVAIAIGLVIIVAIMNFQRAGIVGYKKGSELSAETSALHLLLEHLKDDARSSLRLQTIASTTAPGVMEYRIGRAVSSPDNPNDVIALESRYLFDQEKATVTRREYDCSTGTLLSEKDFEFKTDTMSFELNKENDRAPIDIGLVVNVDGVDKELNLKINSTYNAEHSKNYKFHTIDQSILNYRRPDEPVRRRLPGQLGQMESMKVGTGKKGSEKDDSGKEGDKRSSEDLSEFKISSKTPLEDEKQRAPGDLSGDNGDDEYFARENDKILSDFSKRFNPAGNKKTGPTRVPRKRPSDGGQSLSRVKPHRYEPKMEAYIIDLSGQDFPDTVESAFDCVPEKDRRAGQRR